MIEPGHQASYLSDPERSEGRKPYNVYWLAIHPPNEAGYYFVTLRGVSNFLKHQAVCCQLTTAGFGGPLQTWLIEMEQSLGWRR
jgi:hypothetical protein